MRGHRLVPTLATLVLAGSVSASDGVAPVIALPVDDSALAPTAVLQSDVDPAAALNLNAIIYTFYLYNQSAYPVWQDFPDNTHGISAAGVAIVGSSGDDKGEWQVQVDGAGWNKLNPGAQPFSDDNALLLSDLAHVYAGGVEFRFVPIASGPAAPTGDFTATLVFRAWDGSDGLLDGQATSTWNSTAGTYAGSPSAFSAETRTLAVPVTHTNLPPVVEIPDPLNPGTWINDSYTGGNPDPIAITVEAGGSVTLPVAAYDPEATGTIDWTLISLAYGSGSSFAGTANGDQPAIQYTAGSSSEVVEATLDDGLGGVTVVDLQVTVVPGNAPTIDAISPITVHVGETLPVSFTAHDADGDLLTWSFSSVSYSTLSADTAGQTGPDATFAGSIHGNQVGDDWLTVTVDDGRGYTYQIQNIHIQVLPSVDLPPTLGSVVGGIALAGQPYDTFITAVDPDSPANSLSVAVSGQPSWLTFTHSHGIGRLRGTAPTDASGSISLQITLRDAVNTITVPATITIAALADEDLYLDLPPVSTADAPVYTAIAPGGLAAYQQLDDVYAGLFPDRARGVWWRSGFRDLPTLPPTPASDGVFLATTVDVGSYPALGATRAALTTGNLSPFPAPPQPAPFAIAMGTGRGNPEWHLIGIPPVGGDFDGIYAVRDHDWADFRLETAAGVPVTDSAEILAVLGDDDTSASDFDRTLPFAYDSGSNTYSRVSTLHTGTAYWVPNHSGTATYRLVRTDGHDSNTFGQVLSTSPPFTASLPAATPRTAGAASARSGPPAPPGGKATAKTTAAAEGGCGAGGLAGLLAAAMAVLGLRRGRRG